jgi:hypothetical protein
MTEAAGETPAAFLLSAAGRGEAQIIHMFQGLHPKLTGQ